MFRQLLAFAAILLPASCLGLDHVTLRRGGKELSVSGKCLVTAQDGGLLLVSRDGMLWTVPPEELVSHKTDEIKFEPLPRAEFGQRLLGILPPGFEIHETTHYLICHNTSRAYAQWTGALFERLYLAFTNFWSRKGFDLHDPPFPLVALVFADDASYADFSQPELGAAAKSIVGYYSLQSNRMTLYDLTGIQSLRRPGDRRGSTTEINQMLARPEAEWTVATIIHEATHQIAFNCGLQTRFADIPLWVSEGIAVYFETPDLSSARGWRNIGAVNRPRLAQFRQYLANRPAGSLQALIADDKRFRDPKQGSDAYAEAWALNYFLIRQRPKEYDAYIKMLSQKKQLFWSTPEQRIQEFQKAFGSDLGALDAEFLRHISRLK